jgi:hypothetical protein
LKGSNAQQLTIDQKVSVALPSVAVVEPSPASEYNPSKWYNSNSVQSSSNPDGEVQSKPQSSSFVFPLAPSNDNGNNQQNDTAQKDKAPGYAAFPDNNQDKHHEQSQGPMQRPVEQQQQQQQ